MEIAFNLFMFVLACGIIYAFLAMGYAWLGLPGLALAFLLVTR
jgi:hypothetical protein